MQPNVINPGCLSSNPLKTATKTPAELGRIVSNINIIVKANNVEAEGLFPMTHCDTMYRHNWNCVPLTYDSCSWRNVRSIRNNIWWELIQEIWICKVSRCALVCLSVTQLHAFCTVKYLMRNRGRTTCSYHLSGW